MSSFNYDLVDIHDSLSLPNCVIVLKLARQLVSRHAVEREIDGSIPQVGKKENRIFFEKSDKQVYGESSIETWKKEGGENHR